MSKFWDKLSARHKELLEDGFHNYRIKIGNKYFTSSFLEDEKEIRRMYNIVRQRGTDFPFDEPEKMGEITIKKDGKIISQDLLHSYYEFLMLRPVLEKISSITEIGAGYGRLAYVILKHYPHIKYTIVDIEPALTLAKRFLKDFDIEYKSPKDISENDLFIAVSVLSELNSKEFNRYLEAFKNGKYVYVKDWKKFHNPDDDFHFDFSMIPFKETIFDKEDELTPNFRNICYEVKK